MFKRKKISNLTLLLILCSTVLLLLSSCVEVSEPQVTFINQTIDQVSLDAVDLGLNFEVKNSNPIGIDKADIKYTLSLNGQRLTGGAEPNISIGANKISPMRLPVTVSYLDIFNSVSAMSEALAKGQKEIPYALDGKMTFYIFAVPVDVPVKVAGNIPLPSLPEISVGAVNIDSFDLSKTVIGVHINIKNQNSFALPLSDLVYNLNLNGNQVARAQTATVQKTALPGQTTTVKAQVTLDNSKMGYQLLQAIQGGNLDFGFNGSLDADSIAIPFSDSGNVR